MDKKKNRLRRARKTRFQLSRLSVKRLVVFRSNCHIYAQIISEDGSKVIAQSSTLSKTLKANIKNGGNIEAAKLVGQEIAKLALDLGIKQLAFDRSGFKYHGRVKALADSARENGLVF